MPSILIGPIEGRSRPMFVANNAIRCLAHTDALGYTISPIEIAVLPDRVGNSEHLHLIVSD